NEDAAIKLAETLNFHFTNKKIITIMGMLKDKECEKVTEILSGVSSHVVTVTPPHNPRALPAYELALLVRPHKPMVTAADSIQEAVELSYLMASKDDVILACGSLSYLKEVKDWASVHDRFGSDTHGRSKED
ncbi:MAG: bifunctional folylpolyglutamate synthase/dihydrofolate synthase, partial [Lachnospiraceae bacterium]|nr:bifunctional folylpolyglutamate synthase/dihydrofolate synthase [Lachnospiraceae bacterium]